MIRGYKQNTLVENFGECGFIYEAKKEDKRYFMYELEEYGEAEKYNFKVIKKLMSSHILTVVEQFQQNGTTFIITDYAETDLLKMQLTQPSRVFPLPVALDYFTKLITALEQLHDCRLVYRNIRPEIIKIHDNDIYFSDFTLSQFCKRKQRLFDVVGLLSFLAPQYFGEDGYGNEVDVWAAGVMLFYNLLGEYPFKFEKQSQQSYIIEFKNKCQKGYDFANQIKKCKNPGYLKTNKLLQDFFAKIFTLDYRKRITIKQIKNHKLLEGYFPEKLDSEMLEAINEEEGFSSMLMTQFLDLKRFKVSYEIQKEQVILDFIEKSSESIMLEGAQLIPENIRLRTQFSILKMALVKINSLLNMFYGKKKVEFSTTQEQWEEIRMSSAFKKVCDSIEKREKIIRMLFKSSKVQIPENDQWFNDQIPDTFQEIKIRYRNIISSMFEVCKTVMASNKGNKKIMRLIIEIFTRIVILHLINRIFEEEDMRKNFSAYFQWNKGESLENLDIWIHSERQQVLKSFIKMSTAKYL